MSYAFGMILIVLTIFVGAEMLNLLFEDKP